MSFHVLYYIQLPPTQLISGDDTERLEKGNSALKTQLECANVRIDELTKENKKYVSDLISLKKTVQCDLPKLREKRNSTENDGKKTNVACRNPRIFI